MNARRFASSSARNWHVLQYTYVKDMATKRTSVREAHLKWVNEASKKSGLYMAGAFTDPLDGGQFLFQRTEKKIIEKLVQSDPYFMKGLVSNYTIRAWHVVVPTSLATSEE